MSFVILPVLFAISACCFLVYSLVADRETAESAASPATADPYQEIAR